MSLINRCANTTLDDYDHYLSKTNICREYSHFIQTIPWQWFATLTFSPKINNPEMVKDHKLISPKLVKDHRLDWTRRLCITEKIQVAYFYVEAYVDSHPHIHLLMFGQGNRKDGQTKKTLLNVDPLYWQIMWNYKAKVEQLDSVVKPSKYIANHLKKHDEENIDYDFYNTWLLKKLMKESRLIVNPT